MEAAPPTSKSYFPLQDTIKIQKIRTLDRFAVITLKFEQGGFIME